MILQSQSCAVRVSWIIAFTTMLVIGHGAASAQQPRAVISVWDTAKSSTEPLAAQTVAAKTGWMPIAADETTPTFQGDAALSNGRILAVARKHGLGVELYSLGLGQP